MKRYIVMLVLLLVYAGGAGQSASGAAGKVLRVRDGKIITFAQMIEDARKADFIFIGEMHNIIEHHRAELSVIRAFHESDVRMAVGLEMFRADSQDALDSWISKRIPLEGFIPAYYDNWHEPWSLYQDIFGYAREHEIPMLGLNIPDRIAKKVAREGFASLSPAERKQLPSGISCNVDPTYMAFIRKAYAGHAAHGRSFVNFCEAQMIWDKTMAWHLIRYVREKPGTAVVVLAGVGHAWKRGIPEQVGLDSKYTYRVVLPLIPDQIDSETVTIEDADYVMLE